MTKRLLATAFLLAGLILLGLFGTFRGGPDAATQIPPKIAVNPVCQETYEVTGQAVIYDNVTRAKPANVALVDVTVEIRSGDTVVGTTATDAEGKFRLRLASCQSAMDLAIALVPRSPYLSVSYALNPDYWRFTAPRRLTGVRPGRHDFGVIRVDSRREETARAFQVFHAARLIATWIDGQLDPGMTNPTEKRALDIDFPSFFSRIKGVQHTFYNPLTRQIHLAKDRFPPEEADMEILVHEFAHYLQEGFGRYVVAPKDVSAYGTDGRDGWNFSSREKPGVADLEGFATFLAYAFLSEHGSKSYALKLESDALDKKLGRNGVFNHAGFYYDLYDRGQDRDRSGRQDTCALTLTEILSVFAAHPKLGLEPFSLLQQDASDFAARYERLHPNADMRCDTRALLKMNHLD